MSNILLRIVTLLKWWIRLDWHGCGMDTLFWASVLYLWFMVEYKAAAIKDDLGSLIVPYTRCKMRRRVWCLYVRSTSAGLLGRIDFMVLSSTQMQKFDFCVRIKLRLFILFACKKHPKPSSLYENEFHGSIISVNQRWQINVSALWHS